MKTHICLIRSLAAVMAVLVSSQLLHAQQRNPARSGRAPSAVQRNLPTSRVAVIDISYIFKNHNGYKNAMKAMRQEVQAFENVLKNRANELEQLRKEMANFKPGSQEYLDREAQFTKKQADAQAETKIKRNAFLKREAEIYYGVYKEIQREVQQFAQRYHFDLVVRFNSAEIDPQDRQTVIEGVNRPIVYHESRNDITHPILRALNGSTAVSNRNARQPGRVRPPN